MARFILETDHPSRASLGKERVSSSDNPSVYKHRQANGSSIHTSRIAIVRLVRPTIVDNSSRRMTRLLARIYTQTDYHPSYCSLPKLVADGLSSLQYKSGQCFFQEIISSGSEYGKCNIVTNSLAFFNPFYFIGSFLWPQNLTTRNKCNLTCVCFHES